MAALSPLDARLTKVSPLDARLTKVSPLDARLTAARQTLLERQAAQKEGAALDAKLDLAATQQQAALTQQTRAALRELRDNLRLFGEWWTLVDSHTTDNPAVWDKELLWEYGVSVVRYQDRHMLVVAGHEERYPLVFKAEPRPSKWEAHARAFVAFTVENIEEELLAAWRQHAYPEVSYLLDPEWAPVVSAAFKSSAQLEVTYAEPHLVINQTKNVK